MSLSANYNTHSPFSHIGRHLDPARKARIWAVGGGKGGVGKSLVTANISICLALMGHKVVAVDLDLGGANLHTCLGVPIPDKTLSDYLSRKVSSFEELVTETPIKNLSIISGAQDDVGMANIKHMHKTKILSHLGRLDADYILLDLGAGTSFHTLDFFISADKGIVTALPEPTSIENTYRFIKSVFHRKLKLAEDLLEMGPLIDEAVNTKLSESKTPVEILNKINHLNPEMGHRLEREMSKINMKLVLNQARTQTDIDIGHSMKLICKKYFGLNIDYVGFLEYNQAVWQSVKRRKPLLMEFPNSNLTNNFDHIIHRLLEEEQS